MADAEEIPAPQGEEDQHMDPAKEPEVNDSAIQHDGEPDFAPPDADFSADEDVDETQPEVVSEEQEAETLEQQEAEEMEMMAQAATASVEEHLLAEQQANDGNLPFEKEEAEQAEQVEQVEQAKQAEQAEQAEDEGQQPPAFLTSPDFKLDGRHGHTTGHGQHRFPCLTPNKAHIARLPSPRAARGQQRMTTTKLQIMTRALNPIKTPFPAKVTMSARAKVSTSHPSNYVFNPRKAHKVIGWDEAMSARPPLRIDMDGPTACSYSPAAKPLYETNAPNWTFGDKTFVEKAGSGARTSWEKTWFQSPDVWTQKADFFSDRRYPPPSQYQNTPAMGPHHPVAKAGHSHSIGIRRTVNTNKKGTEAEPAPTDYNRESSDLVTRTRAPSYTHSFRRGGTLLWSVGESLENPGPGTYNPRSAFVRAHRPAFTIQGVRREKSHVLGPYAAF